MVLAVPLACDAPDLGWLDRLGDFMAQSPKSKHLANNPQVSLAYIAEPYNPVYIEGAAEWLESRDEKLRIWDLYKSTPPPLGFDPQAHYGNIDHPFFGLLRFTPWRIELAKLNGDSVVWQPKL